jgi:predicted nucleotidyltransferase
MLYHREVKEYFHAKREAAKRQGTPHLPSNREVHEQLLLIARKVDGDEHERRLAVMRQQALQVMELLEKFSPRLIGSVLTGHIRKGSDIDLHAYSEELDDLCAALEQGGHQTTVEVVVTHKYGEPQEFTHVRIADVGGFEVEITMYPPNWLHTQPRCGITGGAMKRATTAELRQLLRAHPPSPPATSLIGSPIDWSLVHRLVPELTSCQGVLQNHYHHLDVYDHTVEVVLGLERMIVEDFQRFGAWQDDLRRHFQTPESRSLLYLAGICHDLAKPATQSFGRDGRIHFYGHELLGAQTVRPIASRFGLDLEHSDALANLVECHMEALMMSEQDAEPSRIHRLFAKTKAFLPQLALLSLADVEAARGPAQTIMRIEEQQQFVEFLLEQFFENGFLANPCLPVDESDLLEEFGRLEPKLVRKLMQQLMDDFLDGEFEGRQEGLSLASELLSSYQG